MSDCIATTTPASPGLSAILASATSRQQESATARLLAAARVARPDEAQCNPRIALFVQGRAFAGGSFAVLR